MSDFVLDVEKFMKDIEALAHNDFFVQRWWQLECPDYSNEIQLCLISIEDLVERLKPQQRLLIDVRDFSKYAECHMKGSFSMNQYLIA